MTWIKSITPAKLQSIIPIYQGQWMKEMDRCWIRKEDGVCVSSRLLRTDWGKVEHVTITRRKISADGSGDFTWSEKQQIKDELFGKNRVAIEVYPAQDKLVDVADVYHLWVFDKNFKLPFGIHPKEYKQAINRGSVPLSESELNELREVLQDTKEELFKWQDEQDSQN